MRGPARVAVRPKWGRHRRMGSIGRYIFRTTFGAFLIVLVSLTGAIWITQALRDVDLMTSQGQTVLVFIGITSLVIPHLVLVIAPVALVVAVAHNLHKLTTDSEIIVMNGAGMRPWRLLQPFGYRLHWGKYLPVDPLLGAVHLRRHTPRWDDFLALRKVMDPDGVFLTSYWRTALGIEA